VQQYNGVVVDVDDAAVRRDLLRDLVRVVRTGQAGTDVEVLAYPGLARQVLDGPHQERAVGPHPVDDVRVHLERAIAGLPVHGEVVLAAEPVVIDTRLMRDARVDEGAVSLFAGVAHHNPQLTFARD
jgi:hypothetical protein